MDYSLQTENSTGASSMALPYGSHVEQVAQGLANQASTGISSHARNGIRKAKGSLARVSIKALQASASWQKHPINKLADAQEGSAEQHHCGSGHWPSANPHLTASPERTVCRTWPHSPQPTKHQELLHLQSCTAHLKNQPLTPRKRT